VSPQLPTHVVIEEQPAAATFPQSVVQLSSRLALLPLPLLLLDDPQAAAKARTETVAHRITFELMGVVLTVHFEREETTHSRDSRSWDCLDVTSPPAAGR
jgi:hypothetical protein